MKKSNLIMVFLVFMSSLLFVLTIIPENVSAKTLYVGGSGPGNYTTIQSAIDNASSGDTIYVYSGTYIEHIVVYKTLSLIGENRETTIIDGNGTGTVTNVSADWVNITNFTIKNSGSNWPDAGMKLDSAQNCYITNNRITLNNWFGIYLDSSNNNTVSNNDALYNLYGIRITRSNNNTITNNNASANSRLGIYLTRSNGNILASNNASYNRVEGISLWAYSNYNTISNNYASYNNYGIRLTQSNNNTLSNNSVDSNFDSGIHLHLSDDNEIYHNSFTNNTRHAYDDTDTNEWDNGYPSGGNYWDDYIGLDLYSGPNQDIPGSDGIGDTPYVIDSDSQDNYPFTEPTILPLPSPPTIMSAVLSGANHRDVTISWNLSNDDGGGLNNVIRYDIYRSEIYNSSRGYQFYDSVPNSTSYYVDIGAGEGDQSNHFYYVCAVNIANNSSCSPNQAGKFTRPLVKGPNLISVPLIQSNESIEIVLQTVRYDKAWTYDSSSGKWNWYMKFKPYRGSLNSLTETKGYWVNVTKGCNFTIAGIIPRNTTIHLEKGWNLVSFPSFEKNYTVADLTLEVNSTKVEGFSTSSQPYHLVSLPSTENLIAGSAYWVKIPEDASWFISN